MKGISPHDDRGLARNITGSRPSLRKSMEARCWINSREGRPLKMTGAQDRGSKSRIWGGRIESPGDLRTSYWDGRNVSKGHI